MAWDFADRERCWTAEVWYRAYQSPQDSFAEVSLADRWANFLLQLRIRKAAGLLGSGIELAKAHRTALLMCLELTNEQTFSDRRTAGVGAGHLALMTRLLSPPLADGPKLSASG